MFKPITVKTLVPVSPELAWQVFTSPQHIVNWCFASPDWHAPTAANDLQPGGRFTTRMEAKDGSLGFDFEGIYQEVIPHQLIKYLMADGRMVEITFTEQDGATLVTETFDAEEENSLELQEQGWQAILNNYNQYAASLAN